MKKWITFLMIPCFLLLSQNTFAVRNGKLATVPPHSEALQEVVTPAKNKIRKKKSKVKKKGSFMERLAMKIVAKKMAKRTKKQKEGGRNIFGIISLGFSVLSLIGILAQAALLFFIPAIIALVVGIVGIKNDDQKVMAIIGTVYGGVAITFTVIAILLVILLFADVV